MASSPPDEQFVCPLTAFGYPCADMVEAIGLLNRQEVAKLSAPRENEPAIYFSKRVNRAVAPDEPVDSHPDVVKELDYEAEQAVILEGSFSPRFPHFDGKVWKIPAQFSGKRNMGGLPFHLFRCPV